MLELFLFALVLGGGLLLLSIFADLGDHEHHLHWFDHYASGMEVLSLRTVTYFLFAFGGVGATLSWAWGGRALPAVLALAALAGVLVAGISATVFRYLRATESGEPAGDQEFIGLHATVTVPLSPRMPGKILVQRAERTVELLARPYDADAPELQQWRSVVIMDIQGGTALVAPLSELTPAH
ncbi:MAG: hypothetical protein HY703_02830 [Gemmatimonadetes bacterium]|nr:hypothetical protein [Gemmatimonadota bacterium]